MSEMNFYFGNQAGAPSLGTLGVGDSVLVHDACLVNGFATQSVTGITRSGSTATLTKVAHTYKKGQRITIAGATQSEYNITARILSVPTADTLTFTVAGTPATATGTITMKLAAAGFATAFTGTNTRAYRSPNGTRHYFMLNDNSNTATSIVRAFRTMTAVTTGANPFPTTAQSNTNLRWPRPDPTGFPDIPWAMVADEKRFWFFPNCYSTFYRGLCGFGEFKSYKTGDTNNTFLFGAANSDGTDTTMNPGYIQLGSTQSNWGASTFYNYFLAVARNAANSVDSALPTVISAFGAGYATQSNFGNGYTAGESPHIIGGHQLGYCDLMEAQSNGSSKFDRRGRMPMLCSFGYLDVENNDGTVYSPGGGWPDVLLIRGYGTAGNNYGMIFPIGDWDTVFG